MVEAIKIRCKTGVTCPIIGGIVFTNLQICEDTLPSKINYKIRVHGHGGEVSLCHHQPRDKLFSPSNYQKDGEFRVLDSCMRYMPDKSVKSTLRQYAIGRH